MKEVSKKLVGMISAAWDTTCWAILFSKRQCKLLGIMLDYLSIPCMHLLVMLYDFAEKEAWFYKACNSKNSSLDTRQPVHSYLC